MSLITDRMAALGTEGSFSVGADIAKAEAAGMQVVRFNLGEPDFDTPDFIRDVAVERLTAGDTHYCAPAGIESLRRAVAEQVSETRHISVDPERIVVTVGAKPPISYTMLAYVNPGDEVIYPSPGFPIYESWTNFVGGIPVPLHLKEENGFSFTAEELESLITPKTKIIVINSPSNPTGGVLSKAELEGIAEVIKAKCSPDIRIYSDEVYEKILFDGATHHSIASMKGMAEKTILVSGHSKSFAMTGWRLGFAVLPTLEEANLFANLNINTTSCSPPFNQAAGVEAYTNPKSDEAVRAMVEQFEIRRNYTVPALNAIDGITCANPRGAFYVFPNIEGVCEKLGIFEAHSSLPAEMTKKVSPSKLFQKFLVYYHGVATTDRQSFGTIGAEDFHNLRISTAADLALLKKGIQGIDEASKNRNGFSEFMNNLQKYF